MLRTILLTGLTAGVLAGCSLTPKTPDRADIVAQPSPCAEKRFEVYFAENEARLTNPALQAIGLTATQLQGCDIRRVRVIGLADAQGVAADNVDLSQRRAVSVAEALVAAGWPTPAFELEAIGSEGAVTSQGTNEPMRRRTEVVVDAAPR
ncbi:OmpA family protein [Brevundimonas lenta]|uniref:Outer membrane protein OmpA-like peptidoglycan-associated protein n=1 Tax=Brevundimonas lenta TaxID=424796 RepID=A0A7W6NMH0_9CAUL|nr:OmpA family protein [Brevundimonas lenta]MBB4081345.1 outer membrane protein OmpA-like peptidoglycan-associated protein [Brevundimonas lenta]